MNLWEYLDRRAERKANRPTPAASAWARAIPSDFRGWLAFGLFIQSCLLFALMAIIPHLTENQGFLTLASAVIVTGWVGGAVAFAYSAGKGNSEQRDIAHRALQVAENAQAQSNGGGAPAEPTPDVVLKPGETAQAEEAPVPEEERD